MVKNQTAKFTCAMDDTLTVSLHRGKKDFKVSFRHRAPGQKVKTGRDYFDLKEEDKAQAKFDQFVKDAIAAKWTLKERGERGVALTAIPMAPEPADKKANGGAQVSQIARPAVSNKR
jgi:hypothetical protein